MYDSDALFDDADDGDDPLRDTYLTFRLEQEEYAVPVANVTEIIRLPELSEVPGMAPCYPGVLNLRSKVIPVMDARTRFHMSPRDYDDRTVVVVLEVGTVSLGMIVDAVSEVVLLASDCIEPADQSTTATDGAVKAIAKRSDRVSIVLDVDRLTRVSSTARAA
ncbi:MAG: chemotaxis protein CheW [Myxococcota bacterium]